MSAPGTPPARVGAPLAGRESELALLDQTFHEIATARSCRLVTLVGEPGVGKSRLAAELVERIGPDARAVQGGCLSYGEGITYWAVGQVVRDLAGIRDDHSPEAAREQLEWSLAGSADAASVGALLAQLLGLGTGATTPGELAWAIRRFLAVAAAVQPLVLVVDDIQWAERILLDLLAGLPEALPDSPILILCLARPEIRDRAPEWKVTIALEGLAGQDVEELLANLGAPEMLRSRLARVAAGNPLFAEELLAMLADQGALEERDLDQIDLPIGLNAILNARLDRLEPQARGSLERGAIEGEVFHRGAVVQLTAPAVRRDVPSQLEVLAERDFVHPVAPSFPGDAAFRFKHLLVREAVYHATTKRQRATLHEAFADWLEQVAGDRINEFEEILAYHLEQAFRFLSELGPIEEEERKLAERAAAHLVTAARRAAALSDFEAVASMIRRALALGVADPRERVRVRFELGQALHQTRHVAEAEEVLTDTHDVAVQLGVDDVAALALVQLAWNRTGDPSGFYNQARRLEISEQAIEVLTRAGDQRGLALARRLRGVTLNYTDLTASGLELEQALRHARASGDKETIRLTIGSIANAYLCDGPTPASIAIERCEDLLDSVRGDRVLEATVKRPLALFYAMSLRPADALRLVGEASDVLDELELRTAQVYRRVGVYALELAGDLDAAERHARAIWTYFRNLRPDQLDTRARDAIVELARLYCDQGRWGEAAEAMADADSLGRDLQRAGRTGSAREIAVEARLAAHRGSPDAVPQAEEAVERSERRMGDLTSRAIVSLALAEVERAAGLARQANASLERAVGLFELKGNIAAAAAIERRWGPGRQTLPAAE